MEDKYSMQPGQEAEPKKPDAEDVDALVKRILGSLKHRLNVELR